MPRFSNDPFSFQMPRRRLEEVEVTALPDVELTRPEQSLVPQENTEQSLIPQEQIDFVPPWHPNMTGVMAHDPDFTSCLNLDNLIALAYLKSRHDRIHKLKLSWLASWDGSHRAGKSVSAVTWADLLDESFLPNMETRIVKDSREFVESMGRIEKSGIKGSVHIIDEAGVTMSSSDWYEKLLKNVVKMVQMFGFLRPTVFFISPVRDFVDSRLRRMFHSYYNLRRIVWRGGLASAVKCYEMQYNVLKQKSFHTLPSVRVAGQFYKINRIIMAPPPAYILERYQALEMLRKGEMMQGFLQETKNDIEEQERGDFEPQKFVDFVVENYKQFESPMTNQSRIRLNKTAIEFGFKGIKPKEAEYLKSMAERILNEKLRKENMASSKVIDEADKIEKEEWEATLATQNSKGRVVRDDTLRMREEAKKKREQEKKERKEDEKREKEFVENNLEEAASGSAEDLLKRKMG